MGDRGAEFWVTWLILAAIIGAISNSRGKGFWGGFLISLILSPLIGLLVVLFSGDGQKRAPAGSARSRSLWAPLSANTAGLCRAGAPPPGGWVAKATAGSTERVAEEPCTALRLVTCSQTLMR